MLALNDSHDVHIGSRSGIAIARDGAAVAQNVLTRLRLIRGEWELDVNEGTPWFDEVFVDNPDIRRIEITLKERIIDTPGVVGLISFDLDFDASTRALPVAFEAESEFGPISAEATL